jgi:4-hydroxy-tetrahydrodipicolinate reductase
MKIALVGYGKMGHAIELAALKRGHQVVARLSSKEWEPQALGESDVCMEFTQTSALLGNIKKIAHARKPLVIGTTGWDEHFEHVRGILLEKGIPAIYGSNFSIGVNLFLKIVDYASQLISGFEEYDVAGIECHHQQKKDAPSGTAKDLTAQVKRNMPHADRFEFACVRCGFIPGTHTLLFDGPCDTLTLSHQARSREGFAEGAVFAAERLTTQFEGKSGLFSFAELFANRS